ncbi:TetR/AcrR family transcriptional regulator [Adlercreutzia mucosicola]|uniref:TetR/AcrR family transcriptional regulator n=1 Tax=Adlercreutzia mucosicola TaxID=580026 RepID=UPI002B241C2D|nr:TetR family transcriptional regulator [Adlercreutzia mucosicola]MEB1813431.1 TetR/AcrR family transcriptional regulator [Adlercreutzia mucosicola]
MQHKTDRRYAKTESSLKAAINDLLAEKSIDQITVEEISEVAQINRVTFYKHYFDKYDLAANREKDRYLAEFEQRISSEVDLRGNLVGLIHATRNMLLSIGGIVTTNPLYQYTCKGELRNAVFESIAKYVATTCEVNLTANQSILGSSIVFDAAQIMAEKGLDCGPQFAEQAAEAIMRGIETDHWLIYCGQKPA